MKKQEETYETRSVSLWILNDEGLYNLARKFRRSKSPYKEFIESLKENYPGSEVALQTPDGVVWNDSDIDFDAMDEVIRDL